MNAQTYVFIYLNRSIVKYRNFNFKILIFRPLIPLVHSFLTHSSISNFLEALWSNWLKYWGVQWEIRTTCKRKSHSIFSVHLIVWMMMWKLLWQLFFLASCSTPCLDIVHHFLIKHLVKLCFINLKAKFECYFMFKFHNNQIYFSTLIKSVFSIN